jgi:SPP1 family phage portal protein
MTGDILNKTKILKYPKVKTFETIDEKSLIKFIDDHRVTFKSKYKTDLDYYIGKNCEIIKKINLDKYNPDNRITVPHSRTFVQIVKGYMYKPGLITYSSQNQGYIERINEIFKINNEPLKSAELGENQSKYGIGIELVYIDSILDESIKAVPRFTSIDPEEIILIYNMDVEPKLIGAIRYFLVEENESEDEKLYKVEVYFMNRVEIWQLKESHNKKEAIQTGEVYDNPFGEIPVIIYLNNQEYHADYSPVKPLIDAYDVLMSDSINEIQRFASAYLILKEYIFANPNDGNEKEHELAKLKTRRVFEFMSGEGGAQFLTKDIPGDFFEIVKKTLREDIEFHSHIPDFRSKSFEAASGVAMRFSIFDFENLCGDKQALFEVGLRKRLQLIDKILKIKAVDTSFVDIKFTRNLPTNVKEWVDIFVALVSTNKISEEDLFKILPKEIIPDLKEALKRAKKMKEENQAMLNFENAMDQDPGLDKSQEQDKNIDKKA